MCSPRGEEASNCSLLWLILPRAALIAADLAGRLIGANCTLLALVVLWQCLKAARRAAKTLRAILFEACVASAPAASERHMVTGRACGIPSQPDTLKAAEMEEDAKSTMCWYPQQHFIDASAHILETSGRACISMGGFQPGEESPIIAWAGQLMIDREIVIVACREGQSTIFVCDRAARQVGLLRRKALLLQIGAPHDAAPHGKAGACLNDEGNLQRLCVLDSLNH